MDRSGLGRLVENERLNAALSWVVVLGVLVASARSVLQSDFLWAGFAASVAVLSALPPVLARDRRVMLPWPVVLLCALPVLGRAFFAAQVGGFASYLAVAALALVVAIQLHAFTDVEMSPGFAVGFAVIATMATAGLWALVRWISDVYLGTGFLTNEEALMWEFVASTAAGALGGVVLVWYVERETDSGPGGDGRGSESDTDSDLGPGSGSDTDSDGESNGESDLGARTEGTR